MQVFDNILFLTSVFFKMACLKNKVRGEALVILK